MISKPRTLSFFRPIIASRRRGLFDLAVGHHARSVKAHYCCQAAAWAKLAHASVAGQKIQGNVLRLLAAVEEAARKLEKLGKELLVLANFVHVQTGGVAEEVVAAICPCCSEGVV